VPTQLPTSTAFLASLGDSLRDDVVFATAELLDEIHRSGHAPIAQALVLCDLFRVMAAFWKRQLPVSPFVPLQAEPTVTLPDQVTTRGRSNGVMPIQRNGPVALTRPRSSHVRPQHTVAPSSTHATFHRKRALDALERQVTTELLAILKCSPAVLPNHIEERFGKTMTDHGHSEDYKHRDSLNYLKASERARFRLTFSGGQAWQLDASGPLLCEIPADTSSNRAMNFPQEKHRRFCFGYVFTHEGLFMANHETEKKRLGKEFFHSSYLSGQEVLCAGDISFLDGHCTSISTHSGHYAPEPRKLVPVIRFLSANGQKMDDVPVYLGGKDELGLKESSAMTVEMNTPYDTDYHDDGVLPIMTASEFLQTSDVLPVQRTWRLRTGFSFPRR
jgi:hypothetical protein